MSKSKISAFFKPTRPQSDRSSLLSDEISPSIPPPSEGIKGGNQTKFANKKRSYAQYHLELGQPDFMLHQCTVCGMMYARGDEGDEKVHKAFHKEYYEGIAFKGWKNQRVVKRFCDNSDRILMVQDDDSSVHKQKVKQVIMTVEKELGFGEGQLLHSLCKETCTASYFKSVVQGSNFNPIKVYLYISSHKIVGCLVAEPIKKAYKVISNNNNNNNQPKVSDTIPTSSNNQTKTMNFGKFNFKREVFKKCTPNNNNKNNNKNNLVSGAIICEEEGISAILGFRAIWVAPAKRRKKIASHLLDAARKSFCDNEILELGKCAFSPPTSSGKGLACNYSKTASFLVYKTDQ